MANFDSLEKQIEVLAQATAKGFEIVNGRFEEVDQKFKKIDERFDVVEGKVDSIVRRMDNEVEERALLADRLSKIEEKVLQ